MNTHPRQRPLGATSKTMVAMASAPDGTCAKAAAAALGLTNADAGGRLSDLVRAGYLFRSRKGNNNKTVRVRFFSSAAAASTYVWPETALALPKQAPWSNSKPQRMSLARDAPVVNAGSVPVTVCPCGKDQRFSVPPGTVVEGGFASEWRQFRQHGKLIPRPGANA